MVRGKTDAVGRRKWERMSNPRFLRLRVYTHVHAYRVKNSFVKGFFSLIVIMHMSTSAVKIQQSVTPGKSRILASAVLSHGKTTGPWLCCAIA